MTRFITPPDVFLDSDAVKVLLIDASPDEVETIAYICSNLQQDFDIYLYRDDLDDAAWLTQVAGHADALVINTVQTYLSPVKELFYHSPKAHVYGPAEGANTVQSAVEYFTQHAHRNTVI